MTLTKIIRTPKAELLLSREDVRLIGACTKSHYDAEVMRGFLNRLEIYVADADPGRIVLEFRELDSIAKMLEKWQDLPEKDDRAKAYVLHIDILNVLAGLNKQYLADND
jgi:hypothetical protein